jgi:hypothetical protein
LLSKYTTFDPDIILVVVVVVVWQLPPKLNTIFRNCWNFHKERNKETNKILFFIFSKDFIFLFYFILVCWSKIENLLEHCGASSSFFFYFFDIESSKLGLKSLESGEREREREREAKMEWSLRNQSLYICL